MRVGVRGRAERRHRVAKERQQPWTQKRSRCFIHSPATLLWTIGRAPEDGKVRTALDVAILHAQAEAEAYEKAYAREVKRTIAAEEKRAAMDAKVGRLNAREKQVLHLRYGREMSWTAVARRCYISVSAARWCERGAVDRLIRMDEQ